MSPIALKDLETPEPFHQTTANLSKNPLERTWRGNVEGTLKIDGYPSFMYATDEESLLQKREWVKQHLAVCFRFWGKLGYGEGISGHITVRVGLYPAELTAGPHPSRPLLDESVWGAL
jgi:hypothetical protein